jgi:hypothetical protein
VQRGEQVGPVVAGAGHEGARAVDAVGEQDLLVDALLVQHGGGAAQLLGDVPGAAGVALHDGDAEAALGLEAQREPRPDAAAAEDDDVVHAPRVACRMGDDGGDVLARGGDEQVVARPSAGARARRRPPGCRAGARTRCSARRSAGRRSAGPRAGAVVRMTRPRPPCPSAKCSTCTAPGSRIASARSSAVARSG